MIFADRHDAGTKLAQRLKKYKNKDLIVLAIPNGGVAVGFEIAKKLDAPFDVIVVRKIQLPWDSEAGFGACSPDGCTILNNEIITYLNLTQDEIKAQEKKTLDKIAKRIKKYRGKKPFPKIFEKTVIVTDDGLASGYTMIVACQFLKKKKPKKLIVAVPCASAEAYGRVKVFADEIISLQIQKEYPFAVANFYTKWYDVPDEEVLRYLSAKQSL